MTSVSRQATIDGNTAAAYIAYALSDVAAIYPITPLPPWASCATNGLPKAGKHLWPDP